MQEEPNQVIQYATVEDVLKEAGFWHSQQQDQLAGKTDGSNLAFLATYKPIYSVDSAVVTVDGVVAEISEINAKTGVFELSTAPSEGAEVLADYYYSVVDDDFVKKCLANAKSYIDKYMKDYDPCSPYGENGKTIPDVVELVCRLYAAGLLLIRDYGYNVDTELTSKDGYKKIEFAKETLADFRDNGGLCGGGGDDGANGSISGTSARSDGDFIDRDFGRESPQSDNCFIRGC